MYFAAVTDQACFIAERLDGAEGDFVRVWSRVFGLVASASRQKPGTLAINNTDLSSDRFRKGLVALQPGRSQTSDIRESSSDALPLCPCVKFASWTGDDDKLLSSPFLFIFVS